MARINIEDSLFKEKPFEKLILRLGSRRAALGALVEAFLLAQKHYLTTVNDRLIPLIDWQREEIADEIIECGFAEKRDKGIYVRGSDEQFGWLLQRSEAGKSSSRIKAEKKSTTVNDRSTTVNDSQPLTLTPPLSLSLSPSLTQPHAPTQSQKEEKNEEGELTKRSRRKELSPEVQETRRGVWNTYLLAYSERYQVEPIRNVATNVKIGKLVDALGKNAPDVVKFFVEHNDTFYVKNLHAIGLCLIHAESLHTQWKKGKAITQRDVKQFEKAQEYIDNRKDIERGGF